MIRNQPHAFACTLIAALTLASPARAAKRYIYSIQKLETIARSLKGTDGPGGLSRKQLLDELNGRIHAQYPEITVAPQEGEWIFNSVGGSLAEIKVLFCSPKEYLSIWGSPLATEGFSGRYKSMDVWDIMITGLMRSYAPGGTHEVDVYRNEGPDGTHQTSWLKRGVGKHFMMEAGTYMIDYGRGNLLKSLKTGAIMGHKYVTGDKESMHKMLFGCAKQTFANWLNKTRRKAIKRYRRTNPDYGGGGSSPI